MILQSACFTGPRASKMPYDETSASHERLETILKQQILSLIRNGVSEFYTGGQTGIDTLAALLVISLAHEIGTTAHLHLVLPFKDMQARFTRLQRDDFDWIQRHADTVTYINETYTPDCYRARNQYMIDKSQYLIAVAGMQTPHSGTHMTINMARKKGIDIVMISPITFKATHEPRGGLGRPPFPRSI